MILNNNMFSNRPLAVIDMGTNSFHMIIAKKEKEDVIILDREKSIVRLGEGGGDYDIITPEAMERAIKVLKAFREISKKYKAVIQAVATSSVREAKNQSEFLNRVYKETKIKVKVLPGQEEARLIYEGVIHNLPIYNKKAFVIDIGGGSTELILGYRELPLFIKSYKLGAVRLTEKFFKNANTFKDKLKEAEKFIDNFIYQSYQEFIKENLYFEIVAGSSGTVRTVLELVNSHLRNMSDNEFSYNELNQIFELLVKMETPEKLRKKLNLDPKRSDIIVGGALILKKIMEIYKIKKIVYSSYALREGVLFSLLNRKIKRKELNEIRQNSVQSLLKSFSMEPMKLTAEYSLKIFDFLAKTYPEFLRYRELLYYAALLHNIGIIISHSAHHKHSYYIISNTDLLLGFVNKEIQIIASIARYHRKNYPSLKHEEFAILTDYEKNLVTFFSGILRIAIGLSRMGTKIDFSISHREDRIIFSLLDNGKNFELLQLIIEMTDIRKDLLEEFLKKKIVFETTKF